VAQLPFIKGVEGKTLHESYPLREPTYPLPAGTLEDDVPFPRRDYLL